MNQKLFIIIILSLVTLLIFEHSKVLKIENMDNCSLNDETILQNPIFKNLDEIGDKKLINYLKDFDNNVLDDKHLLGDFLKVENIKILEKILNSYNASNPVIDLVLSDKSNIKTIKNFILKNIILNHLSCFGEKDPELFWIKLHMLNKNSIKFNLKINSDPLIEMFKEEKNLFDYKNSKVISYNKHMKNIVPELIKNHPILKDILDDFTPLLKLELHQIIINLLDYLTKLEKPSQKINKQIRNLYVDLRELILINQIMSKNTNLQVGLSLNDKTFILDHLAYQNHEAEIMDFLSSFNTFEKLIESLDISKERPNIRKIFLNKVRVYLKYNGIKVDDNEYGMLSINSVNLKNLVPSNLSVSKRVNQEFIEYLKVKNVNGSIDKFSFRIRNIK